MRYDDMNKQIVSIKYASTQKPLTSTDITQ